MLNPMLVEQKLRHVAWVLNVGWMSGIDVTSLELMPPVTSESGTVVKRSASYKRAPLSVILAS